MKRPTLLIPLLLVSVLTSCKQEAASGGSAAAGMRNLLSEGSGRITLAYGINHVEIGADGSSIETTHNNWLDFERGILKPSPNVGSRGGAAISVSDDGWITLRLQKDVRMIPPTAIKQIEGRMP